MAQVVLEGLVKSYPDKAGREVLAVEGIDLEVADREFMVLVGPSGCGKSTTLRMIAGLESVTAGVVRIDGRVVNAVPPKDRDIAMVFQNYALYPHLTVFENMAFGLKLRKFPRREIAARVEEAAALLGLDELLQRKPKALSGGQRQRVALGRAIVRKPKVFLFDEPLSNLDAKMRVSMRMELAKLRLRLQATVIYVTHDQVEAMTMGDRICVMQAGRILQVDPPMTLYRRPRDRFVAGFIGSPPMNFFRGRFERGLFREMEPGGSGRGGAGLALKIALPPFLREGVEVVLGMRPENIHAAQLPGCAEAITTVEVFEPMGAEAYLHANTGVTSLVARVDPGGAWQMGQPLMLWFDVARGHWFDAASGAALG
ncbi:MAG TPA: sn-glycerol-3-phosphate ABC transporter ATP-binding protein UgpC [Opitutaceae bacterium]|jgi:multiple sugar transport system ATP-binding protein|nr:sn-glycerol-3-phosphate ABC transporter ATP-binding protein UgpC [Opitutaceae bacterium]